MGRLPAARRALRCLRADLRADPYLGYILLGATLLCGFWLWHRVPSFATRDERTRILDPLVAYGRLLDEPGLSALQEGVTWGRAPFGATFYLYALALFPVVLAAAVLGDIGALAGLGLPDGDFGNYDAWQALPAWFWTASILAVRLTTVAFAVGSVYLTYRLGTEIRDRWTGRLGAVFLTLTWGFLTIAHEGGEDMPATFFVVLTLYLSYRFVQSGRDRLLWQASVAGGLAIAFKLTAVPVVVVICAALLARARRTGDWSAVLTPRRLLGGGALGALTIALGFPTLLVGGVDLLVERTVYESVGRTNKLSGPDAPVWWWFVRGYLSALSLPLFLASFGGVLATIVTRYRSDPGERSDGTLLVLLTLVAYLALFSGWHDFRVHHLLPTFPLLALLLASTVARLRQSRPAVARPVLAILLVTSGTYAVAGDVGYAFAPRDAATDWLDTHAGENATMEVYRSDFQDAAVPHGMDVRHDFQKVGVCPEYVQLTYRDRLLFVDSERRNNDAFERYYLTRLLDGETPYTAVASFGPQPGPRAPHRPEPGSLLDILPLGITPGTDQYSDEQELAVNQYTAIYRRTESCDSMRHVPF